MIDPDSVKIVLTAGSSPHAVRHVHPVIADIVFVVAESGFFAKIPLFGGSKYCGRNGANYDKQLNIRRSSNPSTVLISP